MRRPDNKQNIRKHIPHRTASLNTLKYTPTRTIAQINNVSAKPHTPAFDINRPCRILLPDYFNIPRFQDRHVISQGEQPPQEIIRRMRTQMEVRRKLKDLEILAEGMRRAKNIKEESRYYYTQGVLLHNSQAYDQSLHYFEKFLKIVLFIRDEKSIELALNTIGIECMHLKDYQKAVQYHKKQGSVNQRADQFISHINQGLCYQLASDYESALNQYRQAQNSLKREGDDERRRFVRQVMERVDSKAKQLFVTADHTNAFGKQQTGKQQIGKQQTGKQQAGKSQKRPHLGESRSVGRFKDEQKVELAISFAEEKMQSFICQMKNSFLLEK